jgi:hypothetical protein
MSGISSNVPANGRGRRQQLYLPPEITSKTARKTQHNFFIPINFTAKISDEVSIAHDFAVFHSSFQRLQQYSSLHCTKWDDAFWNVKFILKGLVVDFPIAVAVCHLTPCCQLVVSHPPHW